MKTNNKNAEILHAWLKSDSADDFHTLTNTTKLTEQAEAKVMHLFKDAIIRVPAYKDFLKKHNVHLAEIRTIADYKNLPITTKENYIDAYPFEDRCWDGSTNSMHMISTSSGTTGSSHFWPRNIENEVEGAYIHELLFRDIFHISEKRTLFINGFALGNWIAGTFTSTCVNLISLKGYPLTLMSPGYDSDAIVEILQNVSKNFEQIIISGHVPFLKEVAELAKKKKVRTDNIILLGTGQGITENWREYLIKTLDAKDKHIAVLNLYGSADAALMGFETPYTISLRKEVYLNRGKNKEIFNSDRVPSLYNYDPRFTYFEAINDELCITKNLGCPLFRYNIHDEGGTISNDQMLKHFKENKNSWQLPFVYLFGRDKFMVKIYGANVYSEHVQHALNHEKLQPLLTGRYLMEMDYNKEQNPEMVCRIELNPEVEESEELAGIVKQIFVDEVKKVNSEYNFVLETLGDKVKPKIILHKHGHEKYFPKGKIKKTS